MQELPISQKQLAEFMKLASTDAGKKLLSLFKQRNGPALQRALAQKDYGEVKRMGEEFMEDPEVKDLLRSLGR